MLINNAYHITYCTNIHPGNDWQNTWDSLKEYLPQIKSRISEGSRFGVGLRLSNLASEELGVGERLQTFKKWLDSQGLYVFTMNGFPYGHFHNRPVKDSVHAPDWSTSERVQYTKRLFDQLAYLLPAGQSGGISTSPVSYKLWHDSQQKQHTILQEGAVNIAKIIGHLYQLESTGGAYMHMDIEPEPDGLLENSREVVQFFKEYLEPAATVYLKHELKIGVRTAKRLVYRYVTVCYDTCHFALAYESPAKSLGRLRDAGITIGKIQVSAALKIRFDQGDPSTIWQSLAAFNEPIYLHQVTELQGNTVKTYPDLPEVLEKRTIHQELRAHFHVPVFLEQFGSLHSTQDQILEVLAYMRQHRVTDQLEVETYTWDVLPAELKRPLTDSIVRELQWLKEHL